MYRLFSLFLLASIGQTVFADEASAGASWPLCGRIYQAPPAGWELSQGCPESRWGNPDFTDAPLNDGFGPRLLSSRHDFHRGIDIPVASEDEDYDPEISPAYIFSILPGEVVKVDSRKGYVRIRHFRDPSTDDCDNGDALGLLSNCFHSHYRHMHSVAVSKGDIVSQGQYIGVVGKRDANTWHLHLELSEATDPDPKGAWQRDKKNPLHILPYHNHNGYSGLEATGIGEPTNGKVSVAVTFTQANTGTPDINKISVRVYRRDSQGNLLEISQSGSQMQGLTPEGDGYYIAPPFIDFDLFNRLYTPKDSNALPFEQFIPGGDYEMLGHELEIPSSYSSTKTLDKRLDEQREIGDINGILIHNQSFNQNSPEFQLPLTFQQLDAGEEWTGELCIEATAIDIKGEIEAVDFKCSSELEPVQTGLPFPGKASEYPDYASFIQSWQQFLANLP